MHLKITQSKTSKWRLLPSGGKFCRVLSGNRVGVVSGSYCLTLNAQEGAALSATGSGTKCVQERCTTSMCVSVYIRRQVFPGLWS